MKKQTSTLAAQYSKKTNKKLGHYAKYIVEQ